MPSVNLCRSSAHVAHVAHVSRAQLCAQLACACAHFAYVVDPTTREVGSRDRRVAHESRVGRRAQSMQRAQRELPTGATS